MTLLKKILSFFFLAGKVVKNGVAVFHFNPIAPTVLNSENFPRERSIISPRELFGECRVWLEFSAKDFPARIFSAGPKDG